MPLRLSAVILLMSGLGLGPDQTHNHLRAENTAKTILNVTLQHQVPKPSLAKPSLAKAKPAENHEITTATEAWEASQTAVIICDMWDSHHCYRAVRREEQMVPRMG